MPRTATRAPKSLVGALPSVTPSAARISRLLYRASLFAASAAGAAIQLDARAQPPDAPLHRLVLHSDQGSVEAVLALPNAASLAMLTAPCDDGTSRELRALAIDVAFEPLLRWLADGGLTEVSCVALEDAGAAPADAQWTALRGSSSRACTFFIARIDDRVLETLADRCRRRPVRGDLAGAALSGAVTVAERPIGHATLDGLRAGDVVLLQHVQAGLDQVFQVRFGAPGRCRWTAPIYVDDDTITIEGDPHMSDDDDASQAQDDGPPIDVLEKLDVPVRFEVQTLPMSLRDIFDLKPGATISLAQPLASARVRMVACGRWIGLADLVAVGDQLGARIVSMTRPDEPAV